MTKQPTPISVRPDYSAAARNAPNHLLRAAFVAAKAKALNRNSTDMFKSLYPDDEVSLAVLTRAAIAPGSTTTSGWASQLIQNAVGAFLGSLAPLSAAAALMGRGSSLNVERNELSVVNFPVRSGPYTPHWVNELSPIPVRTDVLTTVPLGPPRKLGSIVVMTRELLKRSDAAVAFNTMLREDAAMGLDSAVFSAADGSGDPIAGLLAGATVVAGGAGLLRDLQNLAAAVSAGGSGQVVFIGGPAFAAAASMDATIKATILPSLPVAETRLIAVDPLSIIWGAGSDPDIDVSTEAILHMDDDPEQISTSGSPATVAAPTRSLYQTDCIATRMILPISFAKRRAAAVAYIDNISTQW